MFSFRLPSWAKRSTAKKYSTNRSASTRMRPRLGLECLEERSLLAVNFSSPLNVAAHMSPAGAAVGDLNNDTNLDIVVANSNSNDVSILLGTSGGSFGSPINVVVGSGPSSVAIADFNGDGNQDLAVGLGGTNKIVVLLGNGDGTFKAPVTFATAGLVASVVVQDFNGDKKLDLAVANINTNNVSVLLGNGDGTFQPKQDSAAGNQPIALAWGDFDKDGKLDLAVANSNTSNVMGGDTVSLLFGNNNGTFNAPVNVATGTSPQSLVVDDFNMDGNPDIAVANFGSKNVTVILGNGTRVPATMNSTFGVGTNPRAIVSGDFDGDKKPDLAVANSGSANVSVLLGLGNGTFAGKSDFPVEAMATPTALLAPDVNVDGLPDLITVNSATNDISVLGNAAGTSVQVSSSAAPSVFGQPVKFTALVRASVSGVGTPTGIVNFKDTTGPAGSQTTVLLGSGALGSDGRATFSTNSLTPGLHLITASYPGDSAFLTHDSSVGTQLVNLDGTTTTLATTNSAAGLNTILTITATVAANAPGSGTPTGNVTFFDGSTQLAKTAVDSSGKASFQLSTLVALRHILTAVYSGDSTNFLASLSTALTQTVGTQNERFVSQVYRDLLLRNPESAGLTAWVHALDAHILTDSQVVTTIQSTLEYRTVIVQTLYRTLLKREADTAGLSGFVGLLSGGATITTLEAGIVGSAEYFQNRGGGTNDGFLDAAYADAIFRAVDAPARTTLTQSLARGTSRTQIASDIFIGVERRTDLVEILYFQFLHRAADATGLNASVTALSGGTRREILIASLLESPEYIGLV